MILATIIVIIHTAVFHRTHPSAVPCGFEDFMYEMLEDQQQWAIQYRWAQKHFIMWVTGQDFAASCPYKFQFPQMSSESFSPLLGELTEKRHANESVDEWLSDLHSIASKCEFPSHCCGDGETIRLLGQVIFGVNNDDKWHLEQANQLKHDEVLSHHRAALSAIGICSAKAPSSNTSTPQRQATNVIKDKRQSTTGFWNYGLKFSIQGSCPVNRK
ncbi:hypothetical protein T4D_14380 [Trichinella pseudospiralis]|uniref:Uncharacterized protein n=1 Tax=Trichinella pseudospiralis TaxID=6337 RepID=A0A0V1F5C4_TRIPS|nr:hypothetical protein T4D_14380 [Trichinella pseudospiralis]